MNHKQGTYDDIQNAVWNIAEHIVPAVKTADYLAMIQGAEANSNYITIGGDVMAILCRKRNNSNPRCDMENMALTE